MHAAHKAFIEAEASEKLRRAIKAKTRVSKLKNRTKKCLMRI